MACFCCTLKRRGKETIPPRFAGPNGAGKSTLAGRLLPKGMVFVNADDIARLLPSDYAGNRDLEAGRILLRQLDELAARGDSFAIETTLASRGLAPRVARLKQDGYEFQLVFIWSPSVDLSIARVASRVRSGGHHHHIPEETICRQYESGLRNFFELYMPLADRWRVYRNTELGKRVLMASGASSTQVRMRERATWNQMKEAAPR